MNDPARVGVASGTGPFPPGTLLGNRFRVKAHLRGQGDIELYRASDAKSGAEAAVYVLVLSSTARGLLERELGRVQRLPPHKNLAALSAVAPHGSRLLVAHEWPEGHTLREVIDAQRSKGGTVDAARAHTLLGHVAAALEHASAQLAHGSVNPDNIWLSSAGRVRLTDVGMGAALPGLARAGGPTGAPGGLYLAPEVARGEPATPAADVYGLGAVLFELLTGAPPVPPLQPPSRTHPTVPQTVDAVVGRALLPNPAGRYATPTEMMRALGAALHEAANHGHAAGTPGPAAAAGIAARDTGGRPFDVSAAAGLGQDEARWLVQKERLDFGPFSLHQVKAQIADGVFRGDNLIVDMDSGQRQKIMEHPQLGDFARDAERRLEHTRRVQAEHSHQHVERKKYKAFVLIIGAALLVVGGGLGLYLSQRRGATEGELASRVGEADIDTFLKGVKVDFPSNKRPTARRAARGGSGSDPFSTTTNLGDVTTGGADNVLSDRQIQSVMMGNYRKLVPCIMDARRRSPGLSDMDLEFIVTGAGRVSAVKVNGEQGGAFASCVLGRMQSFNFPKYDGSRTIASWSMSMR